MRNAPVLLRRSVLVLVAALVLAGLASRSRDARADDTPGDGSPATVASLTDEGFALFKARNYRQASERFLQAYALDQDPNLLFNIARCYEALGDNEGAIEKYEAFIAKPDADPRGRRRAIDALRVLRQKSGGAGTGPGHTRERAGKGVPALRESSHEEAPSIGAAPAGGADSPSEGRHGHGGRIVAGWVITGALAAGATVTGLLALDSGRKLKAARDAYPGNGPDIASLSSRTTTLTLVTDGLAAAAAVMAGVSLYWTLGDSSAPSEVRAAVGPHGFQIAGTF